MVASLAERGRPGKTVALTADDESNPLPVPVLGGRAFGPGTLCALRREAGEVGVVVAHGSSAVVACGLATLGARTPFVYRNIGDPSFWLTTPRRRRRMRWILRRAAATVALWEDSAAQLRAIGGDRIATEIIPTGVPARLFPPITAADRERSRRALGLTGEGIVAIFVGALSPEKNIETAIRAVTSIPGATLLLVGDGPERGGLEAAAGTAPGRVRFIGTRERPREELAAADVLVLPSKTEGIPAVLIEAGLSGLPVAASAVGGIPEIVEHGRTGFLVPPGNVAAFATAIREAAAAGPAMGIAARERCLERFEIGAVADAWDLLLGTLGAWSPPR